MYIEPFKGCFISLTNHFFTAYAACSNLRVCLLSRAEAQAFYAVHQGQPFFPALTEFMSSGRICAMELTGPNAISAWRQLLGPTDVAAAHQQAPDSIRALFGTDKTRNACHGSDAPSTAAQEIGFFFGRSPRVGQCEVGKGTTLGVIKPHVVLDHGGAAGLLLDCVLEHFDITAMEMFKLDKTAAAEFYEVGGVALPANLNSSTNSSDQNHHIPPPLLLHQHSQSYTPPPHATCFLNILLVYVWAGV
jgi:nucleoside-diphosphate kinase